MIRDDVAAALEGNRKAFELVCPNILGNPFIPHHPTAPQAIFLGLHARETRSRVFQALYGGAAGGGKSDALLMSLAQYACKHGEFQAIAFRRTFADLALPGALMDRALAWWKPRGVHWSGDTKTFTFPSGARVSFAYLEHETDHLRYQGAEFHQTCWDELTQFPLESQFDYVGISRVRRREGCPIPLRTLAASNPGGPGHEWVQRKFVGSDGAPAECLFVPARISDNPHIDQTLYIEGLQTLHPTVRAQLLDGDWRARDPGDYFRVEWFGDLLTEQDVAAVHGGNWIRWWDLAASEKQDAARTAGVQMVRLPGGVRVITHAVAFRATPGTRDDRIIQQAKLDGFRTTVGIEVEPGSGGIAQFESLATRLRAAGFRAVGVRPQAQKITGRETTIAEIRHMARATGSDAGKAARADPVASCLERGYQRRGECPDTGGPWWGIDRSLTLSDQRDGIRLVAGPWTQGYLDEVVGFPDGHLVDLVDATSGAYAYLEAHPAGLQVPIATAKPKPDLRNSHNASLDDRLTDAADRDRAGRWLP